MLEELSKHDNFFRSVAINISKDAELADDLVQEMYIKLYECKTKISNPKYYAIQTIRNLFFKECKRLKPTSIEDLIIDFKDDATQFSLDDTELEILQKADKLNFLQKNLLKESYDKSLRQIEKEFNIGYQISNRHLKKARQSILGEQYETKYINKRRKRNA